MENLQALVMSFPHCRQLEKDEIRMQPRMEQAMQYYLTHFMDSLHIVRPPLVLSVYRRTHGGLAYDVQRTLGDVRTHIKALGSDFLL